MTFAALLVTQKREKKKSYFMILHGGSKPYPVSATPTHMLRICVNSPTATPFEKGLT